VLAVVDLQANGRQGSTLTVTDSESRHCLDYFMSSLNMVTV
jgi:hypothetical protein